jgi:glycosyltransferase A (GT-A) superfamily protein (DUF2064 family)
VGNQDQQAVAAFISFTEMYHPGSSSHSLLVDRTIRLLESLSSADSYIFTDPGDADYFREKLPSNSGIELRFDGQVGPNQLNEKIEQSFQNLFEEGYERVIAIGGDTPDLGTSCIRDSFERLREGKDDAVVGPSKDGGFYLLGLDRCPENLIKAVQFYTSETFEDLISKLSRQFDSISILDWLEDIDSSGQWLNLSDFFLRTLGRLIFARIGRGWNRTENIERTPLESFLAFLNHTNRAPPAVFF